MLYSLIVDTRKLENETLATTEVGSFEVNRPPEALSRVMMNALWLLHP